MSGGSMNYLYSRMSWEADFTKDTPERKAFGDHLELVIKALHDIEWVDSCDYGVGDENEAIRACLAGGVKMRAAAEEARRVLSMPLLMKGDAPVVKALKMLDEALGTSTGALPFDCRTCTRYMARNDCGALIVCVNGSQYVPTNPAQMWSKT